MAGRLTAAESKPLYEVCPACDGTGVIRDLTVSNAEGSTRHAEYPCPGCKLLRVVEVGVTIEQLEQLVAAHLERTS